MMWIFAGSVLAVIIMIIAIIYRHQRLLQDRAQLMRDAIRHRDFSFRLPTKRLLFGERALQSTLNDMGHEIEKLVAHNEVESWQRLTRVLTHEIMNVITPIRSISQACLTDPDIKGTLSEEGMRAIFEASDGMAAFVENYRKMTQLQEPVCKAFDFNRFLERIVALYPDLTWEVDVPEETWVKGDEGLLRQVFINLVKNAVEAGAGKIGICADDGFRCEGASGSFGAFGSFGGKLTISNDGPGIPNDVAREIFIPFFTTKATGSGIGLSLSRQILLKQHLLLSLSEHPLAGYNVTFVIEPDGL